jgi:hypothetical protein
MRLAVVAALVASNTIGFAAVIPPANERPGAAIAALSSAQEPTPRGRLGSPPQPQQTQSPLYFVGTWRFAWTGRESPLTQGPRSGTVTFARGAGGKVLTVRVEGQIEEGAAYKESGAIEWNEAKKSLAFKEQLSGGTQVTGTGDWSSPLAIRYESAPIRVKTQTVRLRRSYAIISPESFIVTEELSIDGAPFTRLGTGTFTKATQP